MKFFLLVAALLAVAAAQCSIYGKTLTNEEGWSLTFGEHIGVWIPVVFSSQSHVYYFTFKQSIEGDETSNYDVKEWANPGENTMCGPTFPVGEYSISTDDDCTTFVLAAVDDRLCPSRVSLLASSFVQEVGECHAPGSQIVGQFAESEEDPSFSAKAAHVTFGTGGYTIVTAHDIAVFQMWTIAEKDGEETITIVDLMSIPQGHTCDKKLTGVYQGMLNSGEGCGIQLCGVEDSCSGRRELWNGAKFNAYRGDTCKISPGAGSAVNPIFGECSDGKKWNRDPDECFNQIIAGGCVYCEGIIEGNSFSHCVTRQSKDCRVLFEEVGVQDVCNLAYECSDLGYADGSSAVNVSFAVLLVSVLFGLLA